jgi:hypothetical protein
MIALYIIGAAFLLNVLWILNEPGDADQSDTALGRSAYAGICFLILAELWRYFLS